MTQVLKQVNNQSEEKMKRKEGGEATPEMQATYFHWPQSHQI